MATDIENMIETVLMPSIEGFGYIRPSFEYLFVNESFFISIHYDPREKMSVRIGLHNQTAKPQLIRFKEINVFESGIFFSSAMESASINPSMFIEACGEYENGGIRTQNFEQAFNIMAASLPEIEKTLNKQRQHRPAGWTRFARRCFGRYELFQHVNKP
jgi:hypothetical protein